MKPSIGIIAGKGSEGSGVGNDTCRTGQVFTMLWIVSKSYFPRNMSVVCFFRLWEISSHHAVCSG